MILPTSCKNKQEGTTGSSSHQEPASVDFKNTENGLKEETAGSGSTVDFSIRNGLPLFKKYSYFVVGDTPFSRVSQYSYYLKELRSRTVRFSLTAQSKTDEPLLYKKNMKDAMTLFGDILDKYSTLYWHMSYAKAAVNPKIASIDPDNAVYYEPVYAIWNNAWKSAAQYFLDKDIRCYYEVWNEPDQNLWTKFNFDGYIRMYENTAKAVREGNPDAFIGGLSASHLSVLGLDNYREFLDAVMLDKVPIDFISFHDYDKGYIDEVPQIEAELKSRHYYDTTQIHYTEFNIYNVPYSEWYLDADKRKDFTLQKSAAVPMILTAIDNMNSFTDVSIVQWASLMDGSGAFSVIDPNGKRTPAYYAQYLYMHMPVERVLSTGATKSIKTMASADEATAAAMIWNESDQDQPFSMDLKNIPFSDYTVSVYRIDSTHSSYLETGKSDELEMVEQKTDASGKNLAWSGTIPANGTVFIKITTDQESPLEKETSIGSIIRNDNYYKDREQNSYGDFDELTSTALIGTGDSDNGRGCVAVTYSKIQDKVNVTGKIRGTPKALDSDSCLGIRVDYQTSGGYTDSVLYTNDTTSKTRSSKIPFGTGKAPGETVVVDMTKFEMDIKGKAPADWTGKVILTFDIENTGANTEARLIVN